MLNEPSGPEFLTCRNKGQQRITTKEGKLAFLECFLYPGCRAECSQCSLSCRPHKGLRACCTGGLRLSEGEKPVPCPLVRPGRGLQSPALHQGLLQSLGRGLAPSALAGRPWRGSVVQGLEASGHHSPAGSGAHCAC